MEVMIAVSILSVISIGVMTLSKNMSKVTREAQKTYDVQAIMKEISDSMAKKANCSVTVFGAAASGNTVLTGLKTISDIGIVTPHDRLKVSRPSAPVYVAPGMIINGMLLKWKQNNPNGADYELVVTFLKSVKAANGSAEANSFGNNMVVKSLPLQIDNCRRLVASGPTPQSVMGYCGSAIGAGFGTNAQVIGPVVTLQSNGGAAATNSGVSAQHSFGACQLCEATRPQVNGCL